MNADLNRVVSAFGGAIESRGGEVKVQCPRGHHALWLTDRNGRVEGFCMKGEKGCQDSVNEAIRKALGGEKIQQATTELDSKEWPATTLDEFAARKKLPVTLLRYLGVYETLRKSKPVVAFPYGKEVNGKWVHTGTKIRAGFGDNRKLEWKKGEYEKTIPVPYGLCIPWLTNCAEIMLVEGESDTLTLALYGIPALGISGDKGWKPEFTQLPPIRNAEHILIAKEPDDNDFVQKVIKGGVPLEKLYVVSFPADAPDPSALHINCLKLPDAKVPMPWWIPFEPKEDDPWPLEGEPEWLTESGEWVSREDIPFLKELDALIANAKPLAGTYALRSMAEVQMKPVEWLWKDRVPLGKLTIFGGTPGCGKSMVACNLAAIATTGRPFPDSPNENEPMDVLMMFSEDEVEDTVAPRLCAAGANPHKVFEARITVPQGADDEERQIAFDRDRTLLEKMLRDHPSIKLVIVDPLSSFIGDINMNKGQEVRDVLIPLKELAARTGVTFILIAHFNKRSDVGALNKILGAVDLAAVCRAAWLFAEDESEDAEKGDYLMLYGKVNVARKLDGLKYTIEQKSISDKLKGIPYVKWGEKTEVSANQAMGLGLFGPMAEGKGASKIEMAEAWLRGALANGRVLADHLESSAEQAGHRSKTLRKAKANLGIESTKAGDGWYWMPPTR